MPKPNFDKCDSSLEEGEVILSTRTSNLRPVLPRRPKHPTLHLALPGKSFVGKVDGQTHSVSSLESTSVHESPSVSHSVWSEQETNKMSKRLEELGQNMEIEKKTLRCHEIQDGINVKKVKKARGGKRKRKEKSKITSLAPVCKFYLEGRCNKGSQCEFRHEGGVKKKMEPCKFFLRDGSCFRNKDCVYMHGEFPCKFYFWGNCNSNPCRFYHGPFTEQQKTILQEVKCTLNTAHLTNITQFNGE
ncbi:Zinc finger CCCH domain-containing protein 6 [Thelohanellus kitauei]|uniref:Zinc finger CCCH domain-containing protein 6 n=1 Tax=Thelohanellus kitauei TaxID=669202 RepID=A0A0C2NLA1_THEKT|nr:Zinc finger CCCH domain-containing protein 6 [Thelohanellus kitauei]